MSSRQVEYLILATGAGAGAFLGAQIGVWWAGLGAMLGAHIAAWVIRRSAA